MIRGAPRGVNGFGGVSQGRFFCWTFQVKATVGLEVVLHDSRLEGWLGNRPAPFVPGRPGIGNVPQDVVLNRRLVHDAVVHS